MTNDKDLALLTEFLDSLSNKHTRRLYERSLERFCEFYDKSIEELLEMRKADLTPKPKENLITAKQRATRFEKMIEKFYLSQISKTDDREAYSPTSAYNYCKGILQILRYYNMGVALRKGSPITEGSKFEGIGRYELRIEDIRKMFWKARDLKVKLEISMAVDLGWRISDFLSIQVSELPDLNQPAPIEFKRTTSKEHTLAHTCLSKTTVDLLKEFINVYELKPKSKLFPETEETVNRNLRELVSAVGLTCKPKISFHCFRDLVIRTAQNLGVDVFLYKRMVGKSISRDMRGYSSKDVKEAFEKIQSVISINGQILASQHDDLLSKLIEEVTKLSEALITLQKENSASRTVTETLTHKIKQMEQQQQKTSEALRVLADNTPIIYALLKKDYIKAKQLIDQQKQK